MVWTVEITENAAKQIKKLGSVEAERIRDYLRNKVAVFECPRQSGKSLQGARLGKYWRYRVGDYRILCELHDDELLVLVVAVGHRRKVYSKPEGRQ